MITCREPVGLNGCPCGGIRAAGSASVLCWVLPKLAGTVCTMCHSDTCVVNELCSAMFAVHLVHTKTATQN